MGVPDATVPDSPFAMPAELPFERDELVTVVRRLTGTGTGTGTGADADADAAGIGGEPTVTPFGGPGNAGATGGVWRIAAAAGTVRPWSVVLKLVVHADSGNHHWRSSDEPADPMYWKREALLYRSGLLGDLRGGLRGPDCLLVAERRDGSVALWLEDVGDVGAARAWPLSRYVVAARHLGAAQASFVGRADTLPRWLSRDWLAAYVARRAGDITAPLPAEAWRAPLVRIAMPQPLDGWLADVWSRRAQLLSLLAEMPRTLCHLDLWPPNLFADRDGATVVIDWAYAGVGALGEDVGNLVPDAALDWFVDGADARDLHEQVVDGYLAGLSDAGWDGDPAAVRFSIAASAVLKYLWMVPALVHRAHDPAQIAQLEEQFARPVDELYAQRGHVLDLLQALAAEASAFVVKQRG